MRLDPTIHDRVIDVYAELGLPRERIGSWCLPKRDALVLLESLDPQKHRRILEVGTYVGVSTMLLALHAPDAIVDTVDPDLPLELGTPTPGTPTESERRGALEIARQAAARLGLVERVRFHRGGFAVAADYASRRGATALRVDSVQHGGEEDASAIVGPAVGAAHGPFDFIFVDGLHYADAVAADLALAVDHLAAGGVITLHDVVGLWGGNVRWAVHRFLERQPEFVLRHDPYREIYYSGGLLMRRDELPAAFWRDAPDRPAGARLVDDEAYRALLLAAAFDGSVPDRVLELRGARLPSFERVARRLGVGEFCRVPATEPVAAARCDGAAELVIALGVLDQLEEDAAVRLLRSLRERGSPLLLGVTPPGERGADERHSRTLPTTVALLQRTGFEIARDFTLRLEPHLLPYWTQRVRPNSHLLHVLSLKPSAVSSSVSSPAAPAGRPLETPLPFDAAAYESTALGTLYRDLLTFHLMGGLPAPSAEVADRLRREAEAAEAAEAARVVAEAEGLAQAAADAATTPEGDAEAADDGTASGTRGGTHAARTAPDPGGRRT